MKRKKNKRNNMENFFNEMGYELAGDIGAVNNEDMLNNKKLITGEESNGRKNRDKKI